MKFEKVNEKLTKEEMKSLKGGAPVACERTYDFETTTVTFPNGNKISGMDPVNPHNDPCSNSGGGGANLGGNIGYIG